LPGESLSNSDYSNVDTTLWFFYTLDRYLQETHNYEFLEEFYHPLKRAIDAYIQGIVEGIRLDPHDGLLSADQEGKALTWMNALVDNKPVTQRAGKPVEVNALWYHALSLLEEWSEYLYHMGLVGHIPSYYKELRALCRQSFQQRFWYPQGGYLYDVVDGHDGNDTTLRPNQLLALSLRHAVLDVAYHQRVFDIITHHLLTSYGLRTLAPSEKTYRGQQGKCLNEQQGSLHQGSVWPWLLGPYVDALLTMHYRPSGEVSWRGEQLYQEYLWRKGLRLLEPFRERLQEGILGMCPGTFDGDAPHLSNSHTSHTTLAVNTGELLRIYSTLARMRITPVEYIFSEKNR
jgi:predicted glycogen debranching enzyme